MSRTDTSDLMKFKAAEGSHVLSVYLQEHSAESEKVLQDSVLYIPSTFTEQTEQEEFSECMDRVRKFLDRFEPRGETLVIMCSPVGPLWVRQINVILPNAVRWDKEPYWTPFVEALDEFEPYAVIVVEESQARLLIVSLGTTRELNALDRQSGEELQVFLGRLIAVTRDLVRTECPNRLIVAGDRDFRSEFLRLAPFDLQKLVIGNVGVPKNASAARIVELTDYLERAAERRFEASQVDELIRLSEAHKKVATGLPATLDALNAGQVWRLIYSEGFAGAGQRCEECDGLFVDEVAICPRCKVAVRPVADVLAPAVMRALKSDASIEQVRDEGASRLNKVGGIGAFLRY